MNEKLIFKRRKKPVAPVRNSMRKFASKIIKKTPLKKLVEFNTFGATRSLLQELKSAGVAVSRNAGNSSFYSGSQNLINIPRGQAGVAEGVGRRNALFHEAGHAKVDASGGMDKFHIEAHNADQAGASFADRLKVGAHGNEMRRQERLANQTAQADMERMGVPKENIAYFRKDVAGSLNTYRAGHYSTVSQKATFPASSPKATTTQATAAAPTAQPSQPSQSSQAPQPPQSPQAPQPPQSPQAPQPQPTSPFRKKPWVVGGVAAAGAIGVAGYMATRKPKPREPEPREPEPREFMKRTDKNLLFTARHKFFSLDAEALIIKKPPLKKRLIAPKNSMREVGQAIGGPTASFQRKGQLREFAARLRTLTERS